MDEQTVIVAVSNLVTSTTTFFLTRAKLRGEIKSLEDQSFISKYEKLYNEINKHQQVLANEVRESQQELRLLRIEHEKCNKANRRLMRAILKIQDRITQLEGGDAAIAATADDVDRILDGVEDEDIAAGNRNPFLESRGGAGAGSDKL